MPRIPIGINQAETIGIASRLDVALAVDQHCGDGARVAREHGANPRVDRVAQSLHKGVGARQHALRGGRGDYFHGATHEPGRADALEVKIARKIVAARLERLQRRLKRGFDFDKGTRRRRHAALNRQPHAPRHLIDAPAFDAIDAKDETVGMLALLAQLDKTGDRHAGCRKAQHRMIDQGCLERRNGKAQGDTEQA